mmetsp:Transcript_109374/g.327113  ORF Transcript_109374/g.327113 Transcript_109374/m.327113 type:complete len:167 (+) Transcript_109374:1385-1885(+)
MGCMTARVHKHEPDVAGQINGETPSGRRGRRGLERGKEHGEALLVMSREGRSRGPPLQQVFVQELILHCSEAGYPSRQKAEILECMNGEEVRGEASLSRPGEDRTKGQAPKAVWFDMFALQSGPPNDCGALQCPAPRRLCLRGELDLRMALHDHACQRAQSLTSPT